MNRAVVGVRARILKRERELSARRNGAGIKSSGIGRGRGYTMNLPLRAATSAAEHRRMFEAALAEIDSKAKPDLVIISAGFDAHRGDPLGQLLLEDDDFVAMTAVVRQWANAACQGRIVSCLEGGYNLGTLGQTVRAHVGELERTVK
jgi:acetoin utilization deacetylase AcuC-like enzyme